MENLFENFHIKSKKSNSIKKLIDNIVCSQTNFDWFVMVLIAIIELIQTITISKTMEDFTRIVSDLKYHVDCLLIRVSSCEQFIQKLLRMVGQSSSHQKCSSIDEMYWTNPSSPEKSINKKNKKKSAQQVAEMYTNVSSTGEKKSISTNYPSLGDFLLIPSSKETKSKQVETGSFTLMKNAILVNMHEIQKLQEKFQFLSCQNQKKQKKSDQAIELLTKVISMIQQKVQYLLEFTNLKNKIKSKSPVKTKRLIDNYRSN